MPRRGTQLAETDWLQILTLYDVLVRLDPSPVTHLNRAVALSQVEGADAALAAVDDLAGELSRYHLFHAVRGELLRRIGRADDARQADPRALDLTQNSAERQLLDERVRRGRRRRMTAASRATAASIRSSVAVSATRTCSAPVGP